MESHDEGLNTSPSTLVSIFNDDPHCFVECKAPRFRKQKYGFATDEDDDTKQEFNKNRNDKLKKEGKCMNQLIHQNYISSPSGVRHVRRKRLPQELSHYTSQYQIMKLGMVVLLTIVVVTLHLKTMCVVPQTNESSTLAITPSSPLSSSTISTRMSQISPQPHLNLQERNHNEKKGASNSSSAIKVKNSGEDESSQHYKATEEANEKKRMVLDFFIAGFPKCGTTALLFSFNRNNATLMPPKEYCDISNTKTAKDESISKLLSTFDQLEKQTKNRNVKRGIKCPMGIRYTKGIENLLSHRDHHFNTEIKLPPPLKLIVGVRHPILFFQSFYNYRITEMYNKGKIGNIPSPESLMTKSWRHVSVGLAQFELSLMQLGKTHLSQSELARMETTGHFPLKTKNKNVHVFLYCIDQLDDVNNQRSFRFRSAMQKFLELEAPLASFSYENRNMAVRHPEHIDICVDRYKALRNILVSNGEQTALWIREKFIGSQGVFVGNQEHFLSLITEWKYDPCTSTNRSTQITLQRKASSPT